MMLSKSNGGSKAREIDFLLLPDQLSMRLNTEGFVSYDQNNSWQAIISFRSYGKTLGRFFRAARRRSRRTDRRSSCTKPMKTMKPAGWLPTSASRPWHLRKTTESLPGNTTGNCTGGATRSSACSGDSRAFAGSSRASTSSTPCISDSSSSRWPSMHCVVLTSSGHFYALIAQRADGVECI